MSEPPSERVLQARENLIRPSLIVTVTAARTAVNEGLELPSPGKLPTVESIFPAVAHL